MRIFVPKEPDSSEARVPVSPVTAAKLVKLGADCEVERGLGVSVGWPDKEYEAAGAKTSSDRVQSLSSADLVLRLRKPPLEEIERLKSGSIHVSLLDPFNEEKLVHRLAAVGVTAVSMEMIPRVAIAQKMDALSSQANLGGYVAVILAAAASKRILPMMTTAAGTIKPLRMFVIGVGVAGLQAIATGRRLGAWVEAFDTRPVVEEQVKSLGAKFVKIDLGETGETAGGYAKPLTPEQLQKQREVTAEHVALADIVITAAQVFGRKAPIVVTTEMIKRMHGFQMFDSVNVMALAAAIASLDDVDQVTNGKKMNDEARKFTLTELDKMGYKSIPSQANFIMFDCKKPVVPIIQAMKDKNVAVGRLFPAYPNHMRLTIGKREEMQTFLEAFKGAMA